MKCFACVLALVALAAPAHAGAMEMDHASGPGPDVSILFGSVVPTHIDVVAGETVHWSNDSVRDHTVTADDSSFDSGTLGPSARFDRMFDATGTFSYHCRLHPYIRGEVAVHTLLLDRPGQPAAPGRAFPLTGHAALPAGTEVSIETQDAAGAWQPVAHASVSLDGTFAAEVVPTTSGSYRADSGTEQSPAVDLLVLDRSVASRLSHTKSGSRINVSVAPASPGATVVLQLYLKDRFGWWPVELARLDKSSRVTFVLHNRRAVSARVVLTLRDGATTIATGPKLRVRP